MVLLKITFLNASVQWVPMYYVSGWIVRPLPYTSCHRYLQYNIDCHRMQTHRNCYDVMSYLILASIHRRADQNVPLMPDNWSNRNHRPRKCNYPIRPSDNSDGVYSWPGMSSKCRSMYHTVPCCSNTMHHRSHRIHTASHRMRICPSMSVLCPLALFRSNHLSADCNILLMTNLRSHHT